MLYHCRVWLLLHLPSLTDLSLPLLSIIIPAHNEENRLPKTLEQVFAFLEEQKYESEIIIVENGSSDRTYEAAQEFVRRHENLRVIREEQRGKGLAVRRGMLEARGEYRFICDADLSMPIEEITKFLPPALDDFDLAIASREAPGAVRYNEPTYRHWGGRIINLIIRLFILQGLNDTQCGFKCVRANAADVLFRLQILSGWSFDIELLFLARRRGYRIKEIPIHWYFDPDSKISAVRDGWQMIRDIFRIHLDARRGLYDRNP